MTFLLNVLAILINLDRSALWWLQQPNNHPHMTNIALHKCIVQSEHPTYTKSAQSTPVEMQL